MKLLTFRLSGPFQSWGDSARWDHRSSAAMPSKSAVVGLLGCCLGYGRGDARLEALSRGLRMAVRADRRGRVMWDFQTVQKPGGKILNAMGKPRGDTIITPKQYLQEAAFQVFLTGDEALLNACCDAMLHPRWTPCLGRRSCPPSEPMLPTLVEYDSPEEAVRKHFDPLAPQPAEYMECQIEGASGVIGGRVVTRMDEVARADLNQYREREVCAFTLRRSDATCS